MRELVKGVTKIKWVGDKNPDIEYSLFKHKEGTYTGLEYGRCQWMSPEGVPFIYCTKSSIQGDTDSEVTTPVETTGVVTFKVGDEVGLIPDFFTDNESNPTNVRGIVTEIYKDSCYITPRIIVKWDTGIQNGYEQEEIYLWKGSKNVKQILELQCVEETAPVVVKAPDASRCNWTAKHYDHYYHLTPEDISEGKIRLDAYTVSKVWKIGSKDDSGALWHTFKLFPRWGEKNSVEREIKALYAQTKALAKIYNVKLED
jgi:hypothetical protein